MALACALATAQMLLAGHQWDHADVAEHAGCALCLAGSSLDHATTQSAVASSADRSPGTAPDAPPHPALPTRLHRANARAPPASQA